jgi:hypothetical protein
MPTPLPQRVPENVAGDFYVQADLCTQCCLPHGEAPELLNDPKQFFRECYFRRQPQTPEETDRAINAICVSEMDALRYSGTDPAILAKLRERGAAAQCDHTPEGRACLERRANPPVPPPDPPTAFPPPPLTYFSPPSEQPVPRLLRGMRQARKITGWLAASSGVFAGFSSGDRNPLQWPSMFVFMAGLLLFFWAVLTTWLIDSYLAWTSRPRRPLD